MSLDCLVPVPLSRPTVQAPPLQFGIYPGGPAGSVAGKPNAAPEDRSARADALDTLRGPNGTLAVHVYTAFTGDPAADESTAQWMDGEIAAYTRSGLLVELVVRYKPEHAEAAVSVPAFASYLRETVQRYGPNPGFTSLQVTNEANLPGAPDASDGAYAGAVDALVQGVIAAKDQTRRSGHPQVRIGFNWASDARADEGAGFWAQLARRGGREFADAVDWVGLDAYPGTFFPALTLSPALPVLAANAMQQALRTLRTCHMPAAGLGASVPIHVSENGFPTGPGRSDADQAQALEAMVRAVDASRSVYNVSDYNWFDLRDSRSDDANMESQYGLLRDDYAAKPAFARYRSLIAELGRAGTLPPARPRRVRPAARRW